MRLFIILFLISFKAFACADITGFYKKCHSDKGTLVEVYDLEVTQNDTSVFMTATHPRTLQRSTDKFLITRCHHYEIFIKKEFSQGFMNVIIFKDGNQLIIKKSGHISGRTFEDALICQ